MARALFQSWFVDFDPVPAGTPPQAPPPEDAPRNNAAPAPGSAPPAPPGVAALFPATLTPSPLGDTPQGLRGRYRLVTPSKLTMGQSPPGSTYG